MRRMRGFVVVCAGLVLLACLAAEAKDESGTKTVAVNCNSGDSINEALATKADVLIIEIEGTCQEDVVIARDDVTLLGLGSNATVVAEAKQAIWIDRASRITLENLTVTGSTSGGIEGVGIYIVHASGVIVANMTSEGNRYGLRAYGSSLQIVDSDFSRNIQSGLYISNGSSLIIDGEEITASENGDAGLILSESALRSPWVGNPRLLANDNRWGIVVQLAASALLSGPVEATGNGSRGIWAQGGFLSINGALSVSGSQIGVLASGPNAEVSVAGGELASVSGNSLGLYAGEGGYISFVGTLTGNTDGTVAEGTGRISLFQTDCQGNAFGVAVHGGTAYIQDSTIQNVDLSFGARVTFDGVNDVGAVSCDDTVLVEGDVSCPEVKSTAVIPPRIERAAPSSLHPGGPAASKLVP